MSSAEVEAIIIWGRRNSGNVQKVLWAADEMGLKYKQIDAGKPFPFNSTDPNFLAKNPNGFVPVIQDNNANGFVLWESNACVKYLTSRYQDPAKLELYPLDLVKRADADRWCDWSSTMASDPMGVLWRGIVRTPAAERNPSQLRPAWEASLKAWRIFNKHLESTGNKYVIGDKLTFADCCVGTWVHRFVLLRENPEIASLGLWDGADSPNSPQELAKELTAIDKYYATLSSLPAFQHNVLTQRT